MILVYIYSGLLLGITLYIRLMGDIDWLSKGFYLFGYLLLTVIFTDIGAYAIGCTIGKHKLCPTLSPKKSVEGAVGGIIVGTIIGMIYYFVINKYCINY